jgi:hypothetical protein
MWITYLILMAGSQGMGGVDSLSVRSRYYKKLC